MILMYMKNQQVTLQEGLPWGWVHAKGGKKSSYFAPVFA
jgi:hypothetical protein